MGENIGAAARAMKNFGLSELRIVSPRDGWPNPKANSMSVGAIDIIQNAKIYHNIKDAIEDIEFLYATTGVTRAMNKKHVMSHEIKASYPLGQKVAIMFGRENCGLNNNEITHANAVLSISTTPEFCSLNLAHAVSIIAYEIFNNNTQPILPETNILATRGEIEYFFEHLFRELDNNQFFRVPEKYPHMTQNIRNIFARIDNLSKNELQTLRGIITSLAK